MKSKDLNKTRGLLKETSMMKFSSKLAVFPKRENNRFLGVKYILLTFPNYLTTAYYLPRRSHIEDILFLYSLSDAFLTRFNLTQILTH